VSTTRTLTTADELLVMPDDGFLTDGEAYLSASNSRVSGMRFPAIGAYVVPEALQSVLRDLEGTNGRDKAPNVWMRHGIGV
jgi:hypothetical protein